MKILLVVTENNKCPFLTSPNECENNYLKRSFFAQYTMLVFTEIFSLLNPSFKLPSSTIGNTELEHDELETVELDGSELEWNELDHDELDSDRSEEVV